MSVATTPAPVSIASVTAMAPEPHPKSEHSFDHVLGFRTRNQHVGSHQKRTPIEFLCACDVLRRLALQTFVKITPVVHPLDFGQFPLAVRVQVGPVTLQRMRQQNFGCEARIGNAAVFK